MAHIGEEGSDLIYVGLGTSSPTTNTMACPPPEIFLSSVRARRYALASEAAHAVLGMALALTTLVWGYHVVRVPPLRRSTLRAATVTASAGLFLVCWVFFLVSPSPAANIHLLATDLVHQQHLVIGLNLLAAAASEAVRAHRCWLANLAAVALVFLAHPQRTPLAACQHTVIGLTLLVGAYLLSLEKSAEFPVDSFDAPLAACFVATTAIVLVAYREPREPDSYHRTIAPDLCQPGLRSLIASGIVLLVTPAALLCRRPRAPAYTTVALHPA